MFRDKWVYFLVKIVTFLTFYFELCEKNITIARGYKNNFYTYNLNVGIRNRRSYLTFWYFVHDIRLYSPRHQMKIFFLLFHLFLPVFPVISRSECFSDPILDPLLYNFTD